MFPVISLHPGGAFLSLAAAANYGAFFDALQDREMKKVEARMYQNARRIHIMVGEDFFLPPAL